MIVAQLQDTSLAFDILPSAIKESIEWLRKTDFTSLEDKKYPINDQIQVIVSTYETKTPQESKSESHRDFIDIQYLIEGQEIIQMGFPNPQNEFATEYDEAKDRWFYAKIQDEKDLLISAGTFAIFFPTDIHRPGCIVHSTSRKVRKAVVKIPVSILK